MTSQVASSPSTPESSPSAGSATAPAGSDAEREIRFAVVMYGGVSLAIYINGVAQELLNMVRATAPAPVGSSNTSGLLLDKNDRDTRAELCGTAAVYRKLGQYLGNREKLRASATVEKDGKFQALKNDSIKTRFIVDVISGTSAGGINGVFLAKAIVRNQKMDGLKQLWLREGDLGKLLNDSFSVSDVAGFSVQRPQRSLLNSQRMYRKLLEALDSMEDPAKTGTRSQDEQADSPLVGELDLFITTTDIEGLPLPLKLADEVVYERRYKNVFHFRYAVAGSTGSARDDFKKQNDPFLAFAARCTSSFPFAFEAMCLSDIEAVLDWYPEYRSFKDSKNWDRFFSDYLQFGLYDLDKKARGGDPTGLPGVPGSDNQLVRAKQKLRDSFRLRPFGDGGYLDNKPFTHATSMLMRRQATVLTDRKLLYVEPSPEHPELAPPRGAQRRPDFAENVRAAVLEVPREETIREDLDRIEERNEMIERVAAFAADVDRDLVTHGRKPFEKKFEDAGLEDMRSVYGIGYGGYHRLRVEETTQNLSNIITRIVGYEPDSDPADVIGEIAEQWRQNEYVEEAGSGKPTENKFLSRFDLRYALRRLAFLVRRVNELGQMADGGTIDPKAKKLLQSWKTNSIKPVTLDIDAVDDVWMEAFRSELNRIKKEILAPAVIKTRVAEERVIQSVEEFQTKNLADDEIAKLSTPKRVIYQAQTDKNNWTKAQINALAQEDRDLYFTHRLRGLLRKFDLPWGEMETLLECSESDRTKRIAKKLAESQPDKPLDLLAGTIEVAFAEAKAIDLTDELSAVPPGEQSAEREARQAARDCLRHYYDNFTFYDFVTYPMQYGTGLGEANSVDVFRVSPEDATALINERAPGERRRKLAGTALMSFGAFIDPEWRKNDMLWGRLDGAERIITALLPPPPPGRKKSEDDPYYEIRNNFIREAHIAIFREEIQQTDLTTLKGVLIRMLGRFEPTSAQAQQLREFALAEKKSLPVAFESALRQSFENENEIRDYYEEDFEVNRRFDPENALRLISRATNITGRMLEGLADQIGNDPAKRASAWIARFGTVFWGMVAVAVPSSLGNLFARHLLGLLYFLSFITIILGMIVPWAPVKQVGWCGLGISVGLNLILFVLGDIIRGRRFWLRALTTVLVVIIAALIASGVLFAFEKLAGPLTARHNLYAGAAAAILLLSFVTREWRKGFKEFVKQPHSSFSRRRIYWAIFASLVLAFTLYRIGPPNMVQLEFIATSEAAKSFADSMERIRWQLYVDYLFIVAYTVLMASLCIAAAKLFWKAITQRARQASLISQWWRLVDPIRFWHLIVGLGFFLAAAQCVAGLCDAAENIGLLWFLNKGAVIGLTISAWCATIKFALVAAGAVYSFGGFVAGILIKPRNWRTLVFFGICAAVSVVALVIALGAFRFHLGWWHLFHPGR